MREKSPSSQPCMLCSRLWRKAWNSAMALSTLPYIRPTTGTSTRLRRRMRRMMATYSRLAPRQNTSANTMRQATPHAPEVKAEAGATVSDTRMPSLAASSPPQVAGSTNRFCTICCSTTPHTDSPTPVSTSAARRGRRLAVRVSQASPDSDSSCPHSTCRAPVSTDAQHSAAKGSSHGARRGTCVPVFGFAGSLNGGPHPCPCPLPCAFPQCASPWRRAAAPESARTGPAPVPAAAACPAR